MQVKNATVQICPPTSRVQSAARVSAERFRGDAGRSLVPIDSPRHDAARISDLQAIPRVLRRNRDEHIGRSLAEAASSWNHHHGTRRFRRAKAVLLAYSERN